MLLLDFWTYSCINCVRTIPYLRSWYDAYKDDGLVIGRVIDGGGAAAAGLVEGDVIRWRGYAIRVLDTPGATMGSVSYLVEAGGRTVCFCGDVLYEGQSIVSVRPDNIVQMGICQVPEGRMIFPLLTVMENLDLGAYLRKDKNGIKEDLERIFRLFPVLRERRKVHGCVVREDRRPFLDHVIHDRGRHADGGVRPVPPQTRPGQQLTVGTGQKDDAPIGPHELDAAVDRCRLCGQADLPARMESNA